VHSTSIYQNELWCLPTSWLPKQHQYEIRCYIRDPDGYLIEVGQTTDPEGDWSPLHWPSSTPAEASE